MNLPHFLTQGRFFNAKGLSYFWRLLNSAAPLFADAASNTIAVPILPPMWAASEVPKILKHALAKIDIRSKTRQIHL